MGFEIEEEPGQVAKWLQVALDQRKRMATKFAADFGSESVGVQAVNAEVSKLAELINQCIKAQALAIAPRRK